jgi:hypothetical protein
MYPKEPEFLYKEAYKVHLYKEEKCAQVLQSLAVSFIIKRREMNIKFLSDEVG